MPINFTQHAETRAQQRRVPAKIVEWLFEYGACKQQIGAELLHFDKRARNRLAREIGAPIVSRLGNLLDTYAVVSDGEVITLGYRYKRIRRR